MSRESPSLFSLLLLGVEVPREKNQQDSPQPPGRDRGAFRLPLTGTLGRDGGAEGAFRLPLTRHFRDHYI